MLAVPLATFLVGVLAPVVFEAVATRIVTSADMLISGILAVVVVLLLLLIVTIGALTQQTQRDKTLVLAQLERLSRQFGLRAEYVEEQRGKEGGMTYERTRELIEQSQSSLVFVDFWVQTGNYYKRQPAARQRRQAYYQAIVDQIEKHADSTHDGHFHRRIVQLSETEDGRSPDIAADDLFSRYLARCIHIQERSPRATLIKSAPPYIHTHFAVIDGRYVVWPILTSNPLGGGLRRHGALFFDDPSGLFVAGLMSIYDMIDAVAEPYTREHLAPSRTVQPAVAKA